jgi:hypothetical protein
LPHAQARSRTAKSAGFSECELLAWGLHPDGGCMVLM